MAPIRQCPKCGLDLSKSTVSTCPRCGITFVESRFGGSRFIETRLDGTELSEIRMVGAPSARIWVGPLFLIASSSIFILLLGWPKIMILPFAILGLIGAALSFWAKSRPVPAVRAPQPAVSHPTLFKILSLAVGICSIVCFAFLLFGFVAFANSWSDWQRYKGEPYHRADFLVAQVYYHRGSKGGVDAYARGTVEGQREWMSLPRSLYESTRNQSELEENVPVGTSIEIYFFPRMKGRLRVRPYQEVPTAEAYHREAINALQNGLGGLAICGGILFVLLRLRAGCFEKNPKAFAVTA